MRKNNSAADLRKIDVFILCGGMGKRLRTITGGSTPKPMVSINRIPFLDILLGYLSGLGFRRFILGTGYKAGVISAHYRKKRPPETEIHFSRENKPLGTGGAVKNCAKLIKSGTFLVLNGDSFAEFDPKRFLAFHRKKKALISILLAGNPGGNDFGSVEVDGSLRLRSFREKKNNSAGTMINAGVYIFDKKVFGLMPEQDEFSLEKDFFPKIAREAVYCYKSPGNFIDIGTPERYNRAGKMFLEKYAYGKI